MVTTINIQFNRIIINLIVIRRNCDNNNSKYKMIVLYLISIVSSVDGGLFNLASRHRGSEPLWQQVKALERVNSFLKEVQEEIKESRDLLRHINFKNQSVTDSRIIKNNKTFSTIPMLYTNPYFSLMVSNMFKTHPPATRSVTPTTAIETTPLQTLFIRQGPDIHSPVIPDVEPEYKEILPYFRDEVRYIPIYSKLHTRRDYTKKVLDHSVWYPTTGREGGSGIFVKVPPHRPLIAINDYVNLKKNINTATNHKHDNENSNSLNNKKKIRNKLQSEIRNIENSAETIHYNKFKNFGQKRFNVVTQTINNDQSYSREPNLRLNDFMLPDHPVTNLESRKADKPYQRVSEERTDLKQTETITGLEHTTEKRIVQRAINKHLRKIIETSSYSDEEIALIVNLKDQLYHYNKTIKENTEDKVL